MLRKLLPTIKDKNIKLSYREKILILFFATLITVALISKLIMPQIEAYWLLQKQVIADEQKLSAINKQLASVPRIKQDVEKAKQKLETYDKYFSQEINEGTVLEAIGFVAMNSELQLLSFNPQEQVDKYIYSELSVDIVVTGDLDKIITFVDQLEHQQYLSEIRKMNVIVPTGDKPKERAKAQITMVIYLKKEKYFINSP